MRQLCQMAAEDSFPQVSAYSPQRCSHIALGDESWWRVRESSAPFQNQRHDQCGKADAETDYDGRDDGWAQPQARSKYVLARKCDRCGTNPCADRHIQEKSDRHCEAARPARNAVKNCGKPDGGDDS